MNVEVLTADSDLVRGWGGRGGTSVLPGAVAVRLTLNFIERDPAV
jgi:hypothetical protein